MKLGNKDNSFKSEYPIKRAILGEGFTPRSVPRKLEEKSPPKEDNLSGDVITSKLNIVHVLVNELIHGPNG